jgi:fumarylpyruvate hydrolase
MTYLFDAPATPSAPIAGRSERLPIRRIYCVGRNYVAHAREMGADEREPPFFFTKFADTIVESGSTIAYPPATENFHFEAELVLAIGREASNVEVADAGDVILGYATGLDMTRRDLQLAARDKGRPWDMGKNFSQSAPLGLIHEAHSVQSLEAATIRLTVNGETKQSAAIGELIWNCSEIIAHLSRYDRLMPGDLIYTGTPAGVGPVSSGDQIIVTIDGLSPLEITVG